MEANFNLAQPTPEETDNFQKEFNELLEKHSLIMQPIPTYKGMMFNDGVSEEPRLGWITTADFLIQKKIPNGAVNPIAATK